MNHKVHKESIKNIMETITKNHGFRDCGRKLYVGTLLGNEREYFCEVTFFCFVKRFAHFAK